MLWVAILFLSIAYFYPASITVNDTSTEPVPCIDHVRCSSIFDYRQIIEKNDQVGDEIDKLIKRTDSINKRIDLLLNEEG